MALAAARDYFDEAIRPATGRRRWESTRDDAYRLSHQARSTAEAAVLEPLADTSGALQVVRAAIDLEDTVDAVTAWAPWWTPVPTPAR